MDNYWQVKCSSTRESFMPSMAAASQLQPQEPRNQVSNAGLYFHPHVMQSAAHEIIQEAIVPKTSDLLSDSSVHADLGSSFLSLLSGPPSLVQCDLHQFTSAKPFVTSSKVPVSSSCTVGAAGSGVSLACDQTYSQNMSIQNPKIGADLCPVVSPRCGKSFSLLDVLQASILNHHSVEPAKAVICHSDSGNEQVRDFSSLIRSYANAGKLQITSIQASQKAPLEINSSISRCSSTHQSGCPRVFCLGTSGDLLLSNTGLLGIVCLCHGVHMSISMFSEHSGLCDVNPGDAVHMDSGETIAQWRKLYFHKFGIRVPEDHIGWDWPQGISTTASVVKHSVTASNISKNSDLSSLVGSRGGFVGFGQHQNNVAFLGNHITGQKLVNEISCNGQQRNAQGSFNFLHKGLIGASQSNFPGVVDNQLMGCHLSGCVAMSKPFGVKGPENGCHSTFAFGDSHSKTGQSFISYQDLQNLKSSGNDSDINRLYNLKKGNPVEIDAVSSGTELRLGQPSPQSKTLGSSTLPAFNSHLFEAHGRGDPQKFLFSEQLIHNCARHGNSRAMEDHSLNLQYAAGSSNFCAKRGTSQLNLVKHATGINDARDVSIIQQSRDDAERSLAISKLLSQLKPPSDGRMHSIATAGVIDGCHVMPSKSHCESHITKSETTSSAWCRGYATETHLSTNILGQQKHVDKGKEVAFAADSERVATEPNCEFHRKHMESSTNCNGVSGIGCHSCLMEHDNSSPLHQFSGMPPYAFDPGNPFNHSGNIPFLGLNGHLDHGFLKLMRLPKDSGSLLPLQSVSMGFSAPTSTCSISSASPSLTTNEGSGVSTYFLDENLRALAFRHAIELSNEGRADASLGTIQDQGRLNNWCGGRSQGSTADPSSSKEHRHGLTVTNEQVASEVVMKALQSGFTCWMNGGAENIAPAAGPNKCCSFSTSSPRTSLPNKDIEMLCQLACDQHGNEQHLERSGRMENDFTPPNECGKYSQGVPFKYFPGKCGCTTQTNCLGGNRNTKGESETFFSASKEWTGSLNGIASMFLDPTSKGNSTSLKERDISSNQSGNVEGQVKKKVDSHAFQWRDVPSKVTGMHNLTCKDRPANLLDRRENVGAQIADIAAAAKCFNRSVRDATSSKEQEMSNISSGCSAAAVTLASVEFNNVDSSNAGAGKKYTPNLVVDEGSVIDKCWSSDDPSDSERSSVFFGFPSKIDSANEGSSKPLPNKSSRSLIDELRLRDSLILKNVQNQALAGLSILDKTNHTQNAERGFKSAKRERPTEGKMLDASFSPSGSDSDHWHSRPAKDLEMRLQPDQGRSHNCACSVGSSFKQRSELCLTKTICRKRESHRLHHNHEGENDNIQPKVKGNCLQIPENSGRKRFGSDQTAPTIKKLRMQEPNCADIGIPSKSNSADCMTISSTERVGLCKGKVRPVVCGEYGVISNGDSSRPAKFASLRKILKAAGRCTSAKNDQLNLTSAKRSKKSRRESNGCTDKFSNIRERDSEGHDDTVSSELDPENSVKQSKTACFLDGKEHDDVPYASEEKGDDGCEAEHRLLDSCIGTRLKPKCKEIRKRSLYELSIEGKDSSCVNVSDIKTSNCLPETKCRYLAKVLNNAEDGKCKACGICIDKFSEEHQCQSPISQSDAFCCVCGSSNKDEINCLLECGRCFIRVHQACYGVFKVPRGRWYCRPCKTSSKDTVCVLCGYGGGAMTRALRSGNIVKSLLKAWNIVSESVLKDTVSPSEVLEDRFRILSSSTSGLESYSFRVIRPVPVEPSDGVWKMNMACSSGDLNIQNSITSGVYDSAIKQWVHMVCGLWTPGTRCPNVNTMSAFDVSGASCPKANVACSMCNRPGGSCIRCRVRDCSVRFHPWCAHQKGLLQSEVEGVDSENVGFYGRCVLHAAYNQFDPDVDHTDHPDEKYSCARTEGYRGRKQEGFCHNLPRKSNGNGGCIVPQEQLNAWDHITRQKSNPKGLQRLPISDVEHDCRKEYARYKQSKGWKHLVVYKSGIHALGLYTSQFIYHGAMVVEYVGEIVGLRVADKREIEYQSGRKLQYKSACYFFRVDKEHIIDATREGGIARFVNHSCLPNCVAKVISVRNEKKVVFFAERDIYPGEEITYDYHFNHEDEGEKIPCFCNSKNCRHYLN